MSVGANQFKCKEDNQSYFRCEKNTSRSGCCTHNPCATGCRDGQTVTLDKGAIPSGILSHFTTSRPSTQTRTKVIPTTASTTGSSTVGTDAVLATSTPSSETGLETEADSSVNGAVVGGIAGGIGAVIIIAMFVFFYRRRGRRRMKAEDDTSRYDAIIQEKTAELNSCHGQSPLPEYGGTPPSTGPARVFTSSNKSCKQMPPEDAGAPLLPCVLELPTTVYKPPRAELAQSPKRELINKPGARKNSQPQRATSEPVPLPLTTTSDGAVLRPNLNPSLRRKRTPGRQNHVMSFMSYDNGSDIRLGGKGSPSISSLNRMSMHGSTASSTPVAGSSPVSTKGSGIESSSNSPGTKSTGQGLHIPAFSQPKGVAAAPPAQSGERAET